ncbi:zinc carboxypeptidase A 1-like [Pectinophora gossypiella]|uniref:zinc carboxypeptidase A 1-like n=1 Tax=Pectinophora gossypiella TaxID=13191 RepID=UPI00214E536F|nr:zinc carboxypeptidase A 1-like [Pectinophora gossypiella]
MCGCKTLRTCYQDMLDTLQDRDEEACVEDASIGVSTVMIFLKAIKQFCPNVISVFEDALSYEGRHLYEVVLNIPLKDKKNEDEKSVILIDAGQMAGIDSVGLALFIIEQLVACEENNDMIMKVKWVILPSTNPDGMEYSRYANIPWRKNVRPSDDGFSYGVDITRNFEYQWSSCERVESGFSQIYPGPSGASENETIFIKNIISRYKKDMKLYLSIRRDGHAILYPHAYTQNSVPNNAYITKVAGDVAGKVNQRAGGVQLFLNHSIYETESKPHCGHSVDYAYDVGTPLAYEMRVFLGEDKRIMTKFQQLPRGYESSLRLGYFSGIRELYNAIANDKKYSKLF